MDFRGLKSWFGVLPQEYLCVAAEDLSSPLSVYATGKRSVDAITVTTQQLMLGYNPLIMAFRIGESGLMGVESLCVNFRAGTFKPNAKWRGFTTDGACVGRIEMKRLKHQLNISGWDLFVGIHAENKFLKPHQQLANAALLAFRHKPASDANISGNLYDQVRLGYGIARPISVITVKHGELLNFFPTDLHGQLDSHHYIGSLRISGLACAQVMAAKRIAISIVPVSACREVYALGRNHMKELQPMDTFPKSPTVSSAGIPVYPSAIGYLELEVVDTVDVGIHRLFLFRIAEEKRIGHGKTLAHVHAHYVQWRINHGMSTEYFLR